MSLSFFLVLGIFLYLLGGISMFALGSRANEWYRVNDNQTSSHLKINWYHVLALLFFALICGIRFRVGADCESYVREYEILKDGSGLSNRQTIEPLFSFFTNVLAALDADRILFLGWFAFIEILFLYRALRVRSFLLSFAGLILILGPHFLSWNNGLRQVIAALVFLYATEQLLDKKKVICFFVWVFIASLMHKSALLLLPLVLVYYYNKKPVVFVSLFILSVCVYLGQFGSPRLDLADVERVLSLLGYDDYSSRIDYYAGLEATVQRYGPRRLLLLFNYIFIVLFGERMDRYYEGDHFYRVSYFFFMIYACFTEALLSFKSLFSRPFLFFMPFFLIITAYLLHYLKNTNKTHLYVLALLLSCSYSIINAVAEFQLPEEFAVYKLIFFHP